MATTKGVKAWVIRWRQLGSAARPIAVDGEVVAIMPPQWGADRIRDVLERLHHERAYSPAEMVTWRPAGASPEKPMATHQIHGAPVGDFLGIGGNPRLIARRVGDLRVLDEYTIEWVEVDPHHPPELCQAYGLAPCPESKRKPNRRHVQWQRAGVDAHHR